MVQELKTFTSERIYWAVEQVEREAGDIDDLHLDDNSFYLKSEADEVIKELKKACNDKDDWCLHTLKENCHQKYKRCLAMAKWCDAELLAYPSFGTEKS